MGEVQVKTQFTQEEVDDFLEVEPKDMWFVVEVVEVKD